MIIVLVTLFAILAFVLAIAVLGFVLKLLWWALVGVAIGALARLVIPGEQTLSILATVLCGIGGSFVGAILGHRILHFGTILTFVVSVAAAAVLVAAVESRAPKST